MDSCWHVGVLFSMFCPGLRACSLYNFIGWQLQQTHPLVLERFYLFHGIGILPEVSASLPVPS